MITVLLGLQIGDEGKGRIEDLLAQKHNFIVRNGGGNNAGHTIVDGDEVIKLHHLPAGVLHHKPCLLGPAMVISPDVLIEELDNVKKFQPYVYISNTAHIIMPYHIAIDKAEERLRAEKSGVSIGTTSRGIGPCYSDKYRRTGIRVEDFFSSTKLSQKLKQLLPLVNHMLDFYGENHYCVDEIVDWAESCQLKMKKQYLMPVDAADKIRKMVGKYDILISGAQGYMLDLDYGQYPYVTSSHPTTAGVCLGTGIDPRKIDKVVGVAKGYTTYVGGGRFPAEMPENIAEIIRQKGGEFGSTTGRPRRVGWFDVPAMRSAVDANGVDDIILTKVDVLGVLANIKYVSAYVDPGLDPIRYYPSEFLFEHGVIPKLVNVDGWCDSLSAVRNYEDLPENLCTYISLLNNNLWNKIRYLSISPDRSSNLVRCPDAWL